MFPSLSFFLHHYSVAMIYNNDLRAFQRILDVVLGSKVH